MNKLFSVLGWLLIAAGLIGSVATYVSVNNQEFVVALLARVVEHPFEYRSYVAMLAAVIVALVGCLFGATYVALAEVLRRRDGGTDGNRG